MNNKKDLIFDILCNIVIFLLWGLGIFVLIYGIAIKNISLIIIWSVVSVFDTYQVIKHIKNLIKYKNERKKLIQKYNEIIPEGIDVCPNCQAQANKGETQNVKK